MLLVTFPDMEGLLCHILRLCGYKTCKTEKGCLGLSLGKIEARASVPHSKRKKETPQSKITSLYIFADIAEVNIKIVTSIFFFFFLFLRNEGVKKRK